MKRLQWTTHSAVLVPETDAERAEVTTVLQEQGVRNQVRFSKHGISGKLELPEPLTWESDGAVRGQVTRTDRPGQVDAWFWLVELKDETTRRFVYWNTEYDLTAANLWQ